MPGKNFITLLIFISLLWLPGTVAALQKGDDLPELTGKTLDGDLFSVKSLKGKPILLKIGTTWCPSCEEMNEVIKSSDSFLDQHEIQYVDVFVQESATKVRRYFQNNNYREPDNILIDKGEIARALNVYAIPRILLIDKGMVVFRDGGPLDKEGLIGMLEKMLTKN